MRKPGTKKAAIIGGSALMLSQLAGESEALSKIGNEFQVNTYTSDDQHYPTVATLGNDDFVVAWGSNGQDGSAYGIYAQRYDASGTKMGSEFQVNTYTTFSQDYPSVTSLGNGDFVVTWEGYGQEDLSLGIFAHRFDANGTKIGNEFQVNTYTTSDQWHPSIAAFGNDDFVIAWASDFQDRSADGVYARRYDANGTRIGEEFQVNTRTSNSQYSPSVASFGNDQYVISWQSWSQDGSDWGIYAQRYDANDTSLGNEFQVNTYTSNWQTNPSVATFGNNNFIITWQSVQDGSGWGIYAQRYDANGTEMGGEFQVNTYTSSNQLFPSVATFGNDDYVVAWARDDVQAGTDWGVYAQLYDANGTKICGEFQVSTYTTCFCSSSSYEWRPTVETFGNNHFVVTWGSDGQDGSGLGGIYGQLYSINNNNSPVLNDTAISIDYINNQPPIYIAPDITVSDLDLSFLDEALIAISGNFMPNEDRLNYMPIYSINGNYNNVTGELSLTGTDTLVHYQEALRSVTYDNLLSNPTSLPRNVTITVNDCQNISNPIDISISIKYAPTIMLSSGNTNFTENQSPLVIDDGLTVNDVDNTDLVNAQVRITNFVTGEDVLGFVDQNGITGSFNSSIGILTLTGTSSVANYQTALRNVTYQDTSDDPDITSRITEFTVNDGSADSNAVTRGVNVIAVNDAPVLSGSGGNFNYTENQSPQIVDNSIAITDVDNTNLSSAQVDITNFVLSEDALAFVDQNGITGSFNSSTGVLMLTGISDVANYQTALRNVTYENTSDNPDTTTRSIEFTVNDGSADSNAVTRGVNVIAVNDAPVLSGSGGNLTYTENQPPQVIDNAIAVTDVDNINLSSAQVHITNFVSGEDALAFVDQNGITGSFNSSTGVLMLTGISNVANYQTALRNATYENTSENPDITTRSIEFTVNDGSVDSNAVTRGVNVIAVNDAPVLSGSGGNFTYTENQSPQIIDNAIAITDIDNTNLSSAQVRITNFVSGEDALAFVDQNGITGSFNSSTGVLTLTGTSSVANYQTALRSVTYENTSDNPDITARTIEFTVNDGSVDSNAVTRDIDIIAVNDPPIVINPIPDHTVTPGSFFSIAVNRAATFQDPDDPTDSLSLTASQANGDPLPSDVQFDAANDMLQGTLSAGSHPFQLTATDSANAAVSTDFTVNAQSSSSTSTNTAAIAGGVVGGAAVISCVGLLCIGGLSIFGGYLGRKYWKNRRATSEVTFGSDTYDDEIEMEEQSRSSSELTT